MTPNTHEPGPTTRGDGPEFRLITARLDHAAALGALIRETFLATYHHLPARCSEAYLARVAGEPAVAEMVRRPGSLTTIAVDRAGSFVGYGHATPAAHPSAGGRRSLLLAQLYVVPRFHGTGTGAALMRDAQRWGRARNHDRLWLTVWSRNSNAIGFYRRCGLRAVGLTAVNVAGCTDVDLVMARDLPDW